MRHSDVVAVQECTRDGLPVRVRGDGLHHVGIEHRRAVFGEQAHDGVVRPDALAVADVGHAPGGGGELMAGRLPVIKLEGVGQDGAWTRP